jgi:hypothetical protein
MDPFIHVKSLPDFVSPSTPLGRQNVEFLQFLWDKEELSRVLAGFLSFVAKEEAHLHDHPQMSRTRLAWGRTRVLMIETALSMSIFS